MDRADVAVMQEQELAIWLIVGGAGAVCVLGMLGVLVNIIRYETQLHALRNRVADLQFDYALKLARLQGQVAAEETIDPEPAGGAGDVPAGVVGQDAPVSAAA